MLEKMMLMADRGNVQLSVESKPELEDGKHVEESVAPADL
jgi:hypothetical protein